MIHLICLGNPLHADDGFGAAVAHRLGGLEWPSSIRAIDGSKGGGVALFEGCSRAIALQAFPSACGIAGQILRFGPGGFPSDPVGAFGSGTATLLASVARIVRPIPQIEVLGPVTALAIPFSPGLSPLVAAAVETVTAMLARELGGREKHRQRGAATDSRRGAF